MGALTTIAARATMATDTESAPGAARAAGSTLATRTAGDCICTQRVEPQGDDAPSDGNSAAETHPAVAAGAAWTAIAAAAPGATEAADPAEATLSARAAEATVATIAAGPAAIEIDDVAALTAEPACTTGSTGSALDLTITQHGAGETEVAARYEDGATRRPSPRHRRHGRRRLRRRHHRDRPHPRPQRHPLCPRDLVRRPIVPSAPPAPPAPPSPPPPQLPPTAAFAPPAAESGPAAPGLIAGDLSRVQSHATRYQVDPASFGQAPVTARGAVAAGASITTAATIAAGSAKATGSAATLAGPSGSAATAMTSVATLPPRSAVAARFAAAALRKIVGDGETVGACTRYRYDARAYV